MRQHDLELEMIKAGAERYQARVERAKVVKVETSHPAGQRMLQAAVAKSAEGFKRWVQHAKTTAGPRHGCLKYLEQLKPQVLAALTAKCILDAISQHRKLPTTAIMIGTHIEDEIRTLYLQKNEQSIYRELDFIDRHKSPITRSFALRRVMRKHNVVLPIFEGRDKAKVGLTCVEIFRQSTDLVEIKLRKDPNGKEHQWLAPSDDFLDWMKKAHAHLEMLSPIFMPMVEKPMPYNNVFFGGYQTGIFKRRPMVKTQDKHHIDTIAQAPMPEVYDALNRVQNTPMRVNSRMLQVAKWVWENQHPIGDLPTSDDEPLPAKPVDIDTNEDARKEWRRAAARMHMHNERNRSRRLQVLTTLSLADKFDGQRIWYPHTLDFRGRAYPQPYFLQPQGNAFARSLLTFDDSVVMDDVGEKWLSIHVANNWGLDKKSIEERLRWVQDNQKLILRIGQDPTGNMDWSEADEPFAFVAACMEYAEMKNTKGKFHTRLPVGIDACNQGLQLYGLMLRDEDTLKSTNCLPTTLPNDLYQQVCDSVITMLEQSSDPFAKQWREYGLNRSTTKRQTMTLPYGSTVYSCREYTIKWFIDSMKKKGNPFGNDMLKACRFLSDLIWTAINMNVSAARRGMDWLQHCAEVCLDNGVIPQWVTPLGLPVHMRYVNQTKRNIKTQVFGTVRQCRIREDTEKLSKRKSINSMAPNFVHSLDGFGGLAGKTVNLAFDSGVRSFMMIHDQYSTVAPHVSTVAACVREATVQLFSGNILEDLHTQLSALLPSDVRLDTPPEQGGCDISQVRSALYYFN